MGKIINYKKDGVRGVFSKIELNNGDRVLISIASNEIKIFKLKLLGLVPSVTVWKYLDLFEFFDLLLAGGIEKHPLDALVEKVKDFDSIEHLKQGLDMFVADLKTKKK